MPLTATTAPSRSSDRASASASSAYDVRATGRDQAQRGSAVGAADGLRVEAAVGRVGVLGRARLAHREAGHRGRRSVVREPGGDRVARPAVGAGDERVPVAAVDRVAQVGQAVVADGHVGGDERPPGGRLRLADGEARAPVEWEVLGRDLADQGQGRGVVAESSHERFDVRGVPLDLGDDALAGVPHGARQVERLGERVDVRSEPDALHHPSNEDAAAHNERPQRLGHRHRTPSARGWSGGSGGRANREPYGSTPGRREQPSDEVLPIYDSRTPRATDSGSGFLNRRFLELDGPVGGWAGWLRDADSGSG